MSRTDGIGRGALRQRAFLPLLGPAAGELLGLYRRTGGVPDAVAAEIEMRLEACSAAGAKDGAAAGVRLAVLMRLRDLHRYVEEDADLKGLKQAVLDRSLRERNPVGRWEEIRALILRELAAVLDTPLPRLGEGLKRDLSEPGSRLGRLLRLCALLHLEAAGELPPPNLALRFLRGRFPEHVWEARRSAPGGEPAGAPWQPASPLARWEYLAADLAEQVFRTPLPCGEPAWEGGKGGPGRSRMEAPALAVGRREECRNERVYCVMEAAEGVPEQLPLLPVQPEAFLADLLRHVQRRLGAEGVRQTALLLAAGAGSAAGEAFIVVVPALADACGPAGRREARERAGRLAAAVRLLGEVVVQRVSDPPPGQSGPGRVRSTRLLTVLGWEGAARNSRCDAAGTAEPEREALTVLPDRLLWDARGRALGEPFRNMPAELVSLSPREHPYALALAAWLRTRFREQPGVPVVHSATGLLHDAGLVLPEAGRPRAIEALRRDLQRLQELGVLGGWRFVREAGAPTPGLRIEPPGRRRAPCPPAQGRFGLGAGSRARRALS